MNTARRTTLGAIAAGLLALGLASAAQAAGPYQLVLDQGSAFSLLGHSCGGIQEETSVTGFAPSGYPRGTAYLSTRCGGSGRGGGYKTTTYTAWASVEWTWFGETRSFARLEGPGGGAAGFEETDAHGDRIYNSGTRGYLETGEPPLAAPAAPTGVAASVHLAESGESEFLQMTVTWSVDPATAHLLSSNTVTVRPASPGPPVLTASTAGNWTTANLAPVEPNTKYVVTVTSTDAEGTSEASAPLEVTSPNADGEGGGEKGGGGGNEGATVCELAEGTIKLSPGLSETPNVQNITLKGVLKGCGGSAPVESAKFTDHLKTTEEVTCLALQSFALEPTTTPVSLVFKWTPKEAGTSHGSLVVPITEASGAIVEGALEGGPFGSPAALSGTLFESFSGGPSCGVAEGSKKAKAVKSGTFYGSNVELG